MISFKKDCDPEEPEETMTQPTLEIIDNDGPIWVNKFTEDSARAFVKQLQYQSGHDQQAPIVIYVDSGGGEVYALLTMIAAMEAIPNEIVTVALSRAMSAGALLVAFGDLRYATQHSTLLIHEISGGVSGNVADLDNEHANITMLNEKLLSLMAKRCKIKGGAAALKKMLEKRRDIYMSPEEALEFGVIDRIGFPIMQRKLSVEWNLMSSSKQVQQQEEKAKQKKSAKKKSKE